MKIYTATIEKPRFVIKYDSDSESPRSWDNLGYFITKDNNMRSPDQNPTIEAIVKDTGEEAESLKEHMKLITKRINAETDEKVLAIYPVVKYAHSGISYSLGEKHGFDYSNNGFYIVTDKTANIVGTPKKSFKKCIEAELETYNKWVNGEVYGFQLYDTDGELEDSCWGYYDIEDIREALPEEYKDEELYQYVK